MMKLWMPIACALLAASCSGSCDKDKHDSDPTQREPADETLGVTPPATGGCNPAPLEMSDWQRSLKEGCVTRDYVCSTLTPASIEKNLSEKDKHKLVTWRKRKIKNGDELIKSFVRDGRLQHRCPSLP